MSAEGRSRRRELVEEAYNLQVKAGLIVSHTPTTPLPPSLAQGRP